MFAFAEPIPPEILVRLVPLSTRTIRWLEVFSLKRAILFSAVLIATVFSVRLAINTVIVPIAVDAFPSGIERSLGSQSYRQVQAYALEPSNLPAERVDRLQSLADQLAYSNGISPTPEIHFHASEFFGANALAFPGGPVVVTDELVELLEDDDLILSVVAHEFAHITERHSLEQIFEVLGTLVIASALFGVDEGFIEEASAVAVNLLALERSRQLEMEADLVALDMLDEAGIPKNNLLLAMMRLLESECEAEIGEDQSDCIAGNDGATSWFSTHPPAAQRLEYLKQ